jgi:hypothetical protein
MMCRLGCATTGGRILMFEITEPFQGNPQWHRQLLLNKLVVVVSDRGCRLAIRAPAPAAARHKRLRQLSIQ